MKLISTILSVGVALAATLGAANAADVYKRDRVTYTEPAAVENDTWNGGYIGGLIGWNWLNADGRSTFIDTQNGEPKEPWDDFPTSAAFDLDDNGLSGGVYIGADQQIGEKFVVGAIIDHTWMDLNVGLSAERPADGVYDFSADVTGLGTARLRAGYLVTPQDLIYVTGGVAWGIVDVASFQVHPEELGGVVGSDSDEDFQIGWTVGAGYETKALVKDWRFKIEYLYADLGEIESSFQFDTGPVTHTQTTEADLTIHTVRVGVAYEF